MKLDLTSFPYMGDALTQSLFQVFAKNGVIARFVGGCVRDAVLGVAAHDIDIAVPISPDEVIRILTKAEIPFVPTGYDFGTITAVMKGRSFQITSLRQDWQTDGRHARVLYGTSWQADALRRDFTMNALYAEQDGTILDYVGGLDDLRLGIVRFVGDAHQRIQEDYLRILRYFRFLAWYGHGPIHMEALQACTDLSRGIQKLSRERIGYEFLKLLAAPAPLPSLTLMNKAGLVELALACPVNLQALESVCQLEKEADALRRLAALFLPSIDAEGLSKALRLSRKQKQYLLYCRRRLGSYPSTQETIYQNLYQDGATLFRDLTMLALAWPPVSQAQSIFAQALTTSMAWKVLSFPLTGTDLIGMGIKPGVNLGRLLKQCEAWWIRQNFQPDRNACLDWVRQQTL